MSRDRELCATSKTSFLRVNYGAAAETLKRLRSVNYDILLYGNSGDDNGISLPPIKAQKNVLSVACTHLRDAFSSVGFIDSNSNEYFIEEIDHFALEAIIHCIYTGELIYNDEGDVTQLKNILIGADYLDLPVLVRDCETWLCEIVANRSLLAPSRNLLKHLLGYTWSNFSEDRNPDRNQQLAAFQALSLRAFYDDLLHFGDLYRCKNLTKTCLSALVDKFDFALSSSHAFLNLPTAEDACTMLKAALGSDDGNGYYAQRMLIVDWPNKIFEAAIAWLAHHVRMEQNAGSNFDLAIALTLVCMMPLGLITLDCLRKGLEEQLLGDQVHAALRQIVTARMREASAEIVLMFNPVLRMISRRMLTRGRFMSSEQSKAVVGRKLDEFIVSASDVAEAALSN